MTQEQNVNPIEELKLDTYVSVGGIAMSVDRARKVWEELNKLFGPQYTVTPTPNAVPGPIPYYPIYPWYRPLGQAPQEVIIGDPLVPPYRIWCDTSPNSTTDTTVKITNCDQEPIVPRRERINFDPA